jgi:hypothetical protein
MPCLAKSVAYVGIGGILVAVEGLAGALQLVQEAAGVE